MGVQAHPIYISVLLLLSSTTAVRVRSLDVYPYPGSESFCHKSLSNLSGLVMATLDLCHSAADQYPKPTSAPSLLITSYQVSRGCYAESVSVNARAAGFAAIAWCNDGEYSGLRPLSQWRHKPAVIPMLELSCPGTADAPSLQELQCVASPLAELVPVARLCGWGAVGLSVARVLLSVWRMQGHFSGLEWSSLTTSAMQVCCSELLSATASLLHLSWDPLGLAHSAPLSALRVLCTLAFLGSLFTTVVFAQAFHRALREVVADRTASARGRWPPSAVFGVLACLLVASLARFPDSPWPLSPVAGFVLSTVCSAMFVQLKADVMSIMQEGAREANQARNEELRRSRQIFRGLEACFWVQGFAYAVAAAAGSVSPRIGVVSFCVAFLAESTAGILHLMSLRKHSRERAVISLRRSNNGDKDKGPLGRKQMDTVRRGGPSGRAGGGGLGSGDTSLAPIPGGSTGKHRKGGRRRSFSGESLDEIFGADKTSLKRTASDAACANTPETDSSKDSSTNKQD